jgi:hypothetical protein
MTDRAKFEQMLEYLINEDKQKAEELFHELVVAKSRDIYESLLDDDIQVEASDEDEEKEDEDDLEENFGMDEVGADPADDMMGDLEGDEEGEDDGMGMDDMEGEEGGDTPATKDDVLDIKDALADLKAEFEAMLSGEKMGDQDGDGDHDMDDHDAEDDEEGADEFGGDEEEKEEFVREYVEKVGSPAHGDNGTNAKSIVAGKNDMGGTSANIAKGGTSTTGGTQGGLLKPSTTDLKSGNVNVPGGKAGIKHLKGVSKPAGGGDGDKGAGSPLNGAPGRAK